MSFDACPCEAVQDPQVVINQPGLSTIAYRVDDFSGFRRALLQPLPGENALLGWHPAPGDLGLQLLEWWAYLADVLTFYNERIANESYLRTAQLPASVAGLVALIGYRPRPAFAAVGQVAAIRSAARPSEALVIPAGMQLASTATPGVPAQTFETAAASFSGPSDVPIVQQPNMHLLDPNSNSVLLGGAITSLKPGDELLIVPRAWPSRSGSAQPNWAQLSVVSTSLEADPNGGRNTRVDVTQLGGDQEWMRDASVDDQSGNSLYRLLRATQTAALWTQTTEAAIAATSPSQLEVHLSAAVRAIAAGDLVFLDGGNLATAAGLVTEVREQFRGIPYPGTGNSPPAPPAGPTQLPQGDWAGTYGLRGYVLAAWNETTDLAVLPGVSVSTAQANRSVWASPTSDVRALESPDKSTREAATYWASDQMQVELTFSSAYIGNLHLYALDWDSQGRRETITVSGGFGSQMLALASDFSQGAWLVFPIDAQAGATVTITVVNDSNKSGANAVLSGIFLGDSPDIPTTHTVLSVTPALSSAIPDAASVADQFTDAARVAVRFGLKDVGTLTPTPASALARLPANATPPAGFTVVAGGISAFVEDTTGTGVPITASPNSDGTLMLAGAAPTASLVAPLRLLVDLVAVSRGRTVPGETLGRGDASLAGQTFALKQSPLTYLASGADCVSTLQISIDGIEWTEASTFYGQPPDAAVFVVLQLPNGTTQVRFGDGINGARLPTGGAVVATYRYGAGGASPPAGRLTTILRPQPNLASIHNPVAVWGGADAELPADVRRNAPASVLTFARAISADDYQTVAALAPGVTRARAYWTWDPIQQRTLVKVYVGDDEPAVAAASSALAGAEDPNRPVAVVPATAIQLTVSCTLLIASGGAASGVVSAAQTALSGLFSATSLAIGQPLYVSQIEAALLVRGADAVHSLTVTAAGKDTFMSATGPVGSTVPGEGCYFTLGDDSLVGNG